MDYESRTGSCKAILERSSSRSQVAECREDTELAGQVCRTVAFRAGTDLHEC